MSDTAATGAPEPTAPVPREFQPPHRRLRGIVGVVFSVLILVAVLSTREVPGRTFDRYFSLAVAGLVGLGSAFIALFPPRVVLGEEFAFYFGPDRWRTPRSNVKTLSYDGSGLALVFHDLDLVAPPPRMRDENTTNFRQQSARRLTGEGAHLVLPGYTLEQVDEIREAAGVARAGSDEQCGRVEEFQRALRHVTHGVWVTPLVAAANVAVFAAVTASGVDPINPTPEHMVQWGAGFGPLTTGGEWWRLFTQMFLHIGLLHLVFNLWVLISIGPLVERVFGNGPLLVLYLTSGLAGAAGSLHWHPNVIAAGASGAIFGLFGALLAELAVERGSIPTEVLRRLRASAVAFAAFNLINGMVTPGIDQAAHVGGLAAGFVGGVVLARPLVPQLRSRQVARTVVVMALALVFVSIAVLNPPTGLRGQAEYVRTMDEFDRVERRALGRYTEVIRKVQANEMTDPEAADVVEREILPPWRDMRRRIEALQDLSPDTRRTRDELLTYVKAREEAWDLVVRSIRTGDAELTRDAVEAQKRADWLVERLVKSRGG